MKMIPIIFHSFYKKNHKIKHLLPGKKAKMLKRYDE